MTDTVRARWFGCLGLALLLGATGCTKPAEPALPSAHGAADLAGSFEKAVQPFLKTHCLSCHGPEKHKGDLNLAPYTSWETVARDHQRWDLVLERLRAGEMPPRDAKQQPSAEQRREIVQWIEAVRTFEANRNAGDPGPVPARRLSNAEYNYTIRDLTGVDIRPTRDFPVDPANEAGFDNSAESLTTSAALVKKYLEAARKVADHLVLTLDGLEFAPHPVVADTDRDKYCVNRIVAFYRQQRTDYADYFLAAWRYRNRAAFGTPAATLPDLAAEARISPKYLATIWNTLTGKAEQVGPVAALQALWRELPEGGAAQQEAARADCERMRDFVVELRARLVPVVKNLTAPRIHNGSQPLVLWKNRQMAANRTRYAGGALTLRDLRLPKDSTAAKAMLVPSDAEAVRKYEATFERFCATFPDAFYVSERARVYLDPEKEKKLTGRLLSAGFHSQMGYFRDDEPLYELMLDEAQRRELDRRWQELDFVANAPVRQYTGLLWFDRTDSSFMHGPEFDPFRPEDKDCTSSDKVYRCAEVYLAKAQQAGANDKALDAIREYFCNMEATFRWLDRAHLEAEPHHLAALQRFAERAYRRPLTSSEKDSLLKFYHSLREQDGLSHEDALRDAVVSVLMSPNFCFRVDLPGPGNGARRPLSDPALASRLSYFLWGSLPDQELLDHVAANDLHRPEIFTAQVRRMLRDARARGLAVEFGGNWLDFRRFEEHNAVDRSRFPTFDNQLRQAMFEEPVRFFLDLMNRDGSVLDFLYADSTWVNPPLARHYGMPVPAGGAESWVRVEGARKYGRGGLLPMAVFLTKNAPGLRTSPVKRGYWVARRVLGEHIPAPPPNVPQLPADESKLGDSTLRDALARHRADRSCAACHERFDSLGLVFEAYGPVGERRTRDLGGRAVDTKVTFPGGSGGDGLDGLTSYIKQHRQQDFVDNLCRKLLAYALNRSLLLSDEQLIREMQARLAADGYRFSSLVDTIVTSPQFLNQRGDAVAATKGD